MGAIVIRTRYDEGTESAEVATSAYILYQALTLYITWMSPLVYIHILGITIWFTSVYYLDANTSVYYSGVPSSVYHLQIYPSSSCTCICQWEGRLSMYICNTWIVDLPIDGNKRMRPLLYNTSVSLLSFFLFVFKFITSAYVRIQTDWIFCPPLQFRVYIHHVALSAADDRGCWQFLRHQEEIVPYYMT